VEKSDLSGRRGANSRCHLLTAAVRHHYGVKEELFEVTVTTHPEGRYTYTMDMQRSLRPPL
jgi:hypothetical protein